MERIAGMLEKFAPLSCQPVILCSAQIRAHLKKLADRFIPNLAVLSYNEILHDTKIQSLGTVGIKNAD
jgi:flagellar biosynthesis protein FlhA